MTAALILMDVENFSFASSKPYLMTEIDPSLANVHNSMSTVSCLRLILALNIHLAGSPKKENHPVWNMDRLSEIAEEIQRFLGVTAPWSLEIVLSSGGPESSDNALQLALEHAPDDTPEAVGPFSRIALLTHDRGLRKEFTKKISTTTTPGSAELFRTYGLTCWNMTAPKPFQRQAPSPLVDNTPADTTTADPIGPTVFVDNPDTAARMQHREVQCRGNIADIASAALRFPALLTQISYTTDLDTSSGCGRGTARLMEILDGKSPLLACAPEDGLEWDHRMEQTGCAISPNATVTSVTPSPAGSGVVRLVLTDHDTEWTLSARSVLPLQILQAMVHAIAPRKNWQSLSDIDDEFILMKASGRFLSEARQVRFESTSSGLGFQISQPYSTATDFWVTPNREGRLHGKIKKRANILCRGSNKATVTAVPVVLPDQHGYPQVGWRAVIASDDTFKSKAPVQQGKMGIAIRQSDGVRFAFLALTEIATGPIPFIMPIQEVPENSLHGVLKTGSADTLNSLRILPLLVARKNMIYFGTKRVRNRNVQTSVEVKR